MTDLDNSLLNPLAISFFPSKSLVSKEIFPTKNVTSITSLVTHNTGSRKSGKENAELLAQCNVKDHTFVKRIESCCPVYQRNTTRKTRHPQRESTKWYSNSNKDPHSSRSYENYGQRHRYHYVKRTSNHGNDWDSQVLMPEVTANIPVISDGDFPPLVDHEEPKKHLPKTITSAPLTFVSVLSTSSENYVSDSIGTDIANLKPGWIDISNLREYLAPQLIPRLRSPDESAALIPCEKSNSDRTESSNDSSPVEVGYYRSNSTPKPPTITSDGEGTSGSKVIENSVEDPFLGPVPIIRTSPDSSARARLSSKWLALAMEYTERKSKEESFSTTPMSRETEGGTNTVCNTGTYVHPEDSVRRWHNVLAPRASMQNWSQNIEPAHPPSPYDGIDAGHTSRVGLGHGSSDDNQGDIFGDTDIQDRAARLSSPSTLDPAAPISTVDPWQPQQSESPGICVDRDGSAMEELLQRWTMASSAGDLDGLRGIHAYCRGRSLCSDPARGLFQVDTLPHTLHVLATLGHATCLDWLVSTFKVDVDCKDADKCTALLLACASGHLECVRVLVDHGASIVARDKLADSTLHKAARSGSKTLISWLCDRKRLSSQQLNGRNKRRETPLMLAALHASRDIVVQLIAAGADPSCQDVDGLDAACLAVRRGDVGVLEAVLMCNNRNSSCGHGKAPGGRGGDTVRQFSSAKLNSNRFPATCSPSVVRVKAYTTPLHQAALFGNIRCLRLLLRHGSPRDLTVYSSPDGLVPVMTACAHGHVDVVRELLFPHMESGQSAAAVTGAVTASLTLEDSRGFTALVHAVRGPKALLCTQCILEYGSFPLRHVNGLGETVLEAALRRGRPAARVSCYSAPTGCASTELLDTAVAGVTDTACGTVRSSEISNELISALARLLRADAAVTDRFFMRLSGGYKIVSEGLLLSRLTSVKLDISSNEMYLIPCDFGKISENPVDTAYADVRVELIDGYLLLHAFILGRLSPVLHTMLTSPMVQVDGQTGMVVLRFPQHTRTVFRTLVQWMYTGREVTEDLALDALLDTLLLANEFLVDGLQSLCERRLVSCDGVAVDRQLWESLCEALPLPCLQSYLLAHSGGNSRSERGGISDDSISSAGQQSLEGMAYVTPTDEWYSEFRRKLYSNAQDADLVLVAADGYRLPVHRAVVAAHSAKLAAMLDFLRSSDHLRTSCGVGRGVGSDARLKIPPYRYTCTGHEDWGGDETPPPSILELQLHGVSCECLVALVGFMYCGREFFTEPFTLPTVTSADEGNETDGSNGDDHDYYDSISQPGGRDVNAASNAQLPHELCGGSVTEGHLQLLWLADEYLVESLRAYCVHTLAADVSRDPEALEAVFAAADALGLDELLTNCAVKVLGQARRLETDLCERAIAVLSRSRTA